MQCKELLSQRFHRSAWVRVSLTGRPFVDLTDVTLADEDTNPIQTDNANRTFQGNLATRVTQPGGQIWNQAMQVT